MYWHVVCELIIQSIMLCSTINIMMNPYADNHETYSTFHIARSCSLYELLIHFKKPEFAINLLCMFTLEKAFF